jgi:two-component sensor histidine kinase/HAMP domain-containing protein
VETSGATRGPIARARAWRARSISNQITAAAVSLTLAVAAVIGGTTYLAVRALVARNIASALEGQARLVEQRLVSDLATAVKDVAELAQNSFVANGLVDSQGRDTYLLPFLREHRHPGEPHAVLVLCDFRGNPIASNAPAAQAFVGRIAGVRKVLETAKPFAELLVEAGRGHLVISNPVIFPPTGQVEGVIVERFELAAMLAGASEYLSKEESAQLEVGSITVDSGDGPRAAPVASVTVRPRLPAQLAFMDASLVVGTRKAIYLPLRWVGFLYLLVGGATVVIVVRASRAMARRLAGPIEALSRTAGEVAAGGDPELPSAEGGATEVNALTTAIAAMLGKLRASQEDLEQRVRDRTAELQRRERELARYAETQAVLLREVNHRVKNNLSAIISVLHLEEGRAGVRDEPVVVGILGEMESRIRSLATIHALLSGVEWRPLPLGELCQKLLRSSLGGTDASAVELRVDASPVLVESGQAHHLALVLNELVTNTLKYARVADRPCQVDVAIAGDESGVVLTYRDDGPGFPAAVIGGASDALGTGLQLLRGIVETSLGGQLSLSNDGGAVVAVRFAPNPPQTAGGQP